MTGDQGWELATALAGMSRDLLGRDTVQETLDRIVEYAATIVDGCETAGIMTVHKRVTSNVAATSELARALDRAQGELGEGSCFDATTQRQQAFRIADLGTASTRWPRFAPHALGFGVGSMMGFLLYTTGKDNLGALNMYSARPDAFTARSEQVGWLLASHAAVALVSARHAENMEFALQSSRAIGEAIGIVMVQRKISESAAFDLLRSSSQRSNMKLRDLAESIILTGQLPGTPDL